MTSAACCTLASSSSDSVSRLFHKPARHSLRCGGHPGTKRESLPTASVVVVACESGQRDSTARTWRAPPWLRAPPSAPTARPPSCTAHPAAHTSSRDTSPHGCRCIVPLRTHTPPAACCRDVARVSQAQASGMLLLLWRTLWRTSLVQLHNPHHPNRHIAPAPTSSPYPRPFSTAPTRTRPPRLLRLRIQHPLPVEREPLALACTWEPLAIAPSLSVRSSMSASSTLSHRSTHPSLPQPHSLLSRA